MAEAQTYTGSCHCGNVKFEVTGDMTHVISCNCSICSRTGALLAFVPAAQFKLLKGEDAQGDYQFNKHVIHHVFCRVCGIKSFARGVARDGSATVAINTRCLDDIDLARLNVTPFDGKSR